MRSKKYCMLKLMVFAWLLPGMSLAQQSQINPSGPITVLICYPGGKVNSQEAKSVTDSMLQILEESGGWPRGTISSQFTSESEDCRKYLTEKKPQFAITSLGIFLEHRADLNLLPLVQLRIQGSSTDTYRILVRQGAFTSIEELKGKILGGSLLQDPTFLKRIIFQGSVDPASYFTLQNSRRVLRSLRDLSMGKLDAVMVNDQQYQALGSLPFADQLQVVFTSKAVPLLGVAANGNSTSADDRRRFSQALYNICSRQNGKQLCELFGLEAFVPADIKAFDKIISLWDSQ